MSLPFETTKLVEICRTNDVARLGVFGSAVHGDFGPDSDVDLIVEFSKRKSLLFVVALQRLFTEALGRKVDLLTEAALSPYLRERIIRDVQVIYEAG